MENINSKMVAKSFVAIFGAIGLLNCVSGSNSSRNEGNV